MNHAFRIAALVGIAMGWIGMAESRAGDQFGACQRCAAPDGCCYYQVTKYRCVLVPDTKQIKKTVYECRDVPYCEHRLPKFGHYECCPECAACPKFKKVMVKREVVVAEVCGTKCVVEAYCEQVPGPCRHCGVPSGPPSPPPYVDAPVPPPALPAPSKSAFLVPDSVEELKTR